MIFDWIKKSPFTALMLPTALSALGFLGHLAIALSDGHLDASELESLMSSASAAQAALLAIIMYALKKEKNN